VVYILSDAKISVLVISNKKHCYQPKKALSVKLYQYNPIYIVSCARLLAKFDWDTCGKSGFILISIITSYPSMTGHLLPG